MIAIYLGFEKIYLIGMDHNYFLYKNEEDMRLYKNAIHQKNEFKRSFGNMFYINEYLRQYNIFSKYFYLNNINRVEIYNATRGGVLEVFPRVEYESLV
jgi:hypothetical protein